MPTDHVSLTAILISYQIDRRLFKSNYFQCTPLSTSLQTVLFVDTLGNCTSYPLLLWFSEIKYADHGPEMVVRLFLISDVMVERVLQEP